VAGADATAAGRLQGDAYLTVLHRGATKQIIQLNGPQRRRPGLILFTVHTRSRC
jgi:hypothetical protein